MPDEPVIEDRRSDQSPGPGAMLKGAREEQGLSIEHVAAELHLGEAQIRSLEQENFDAFGAPVFVRGHLRKYSNLLKLDTVRVMQLLSDHYAGRDPDQSVVETEVERTLHREKRLNGLLIIVTVAVLAAILAYLGYRYTQRLPQQVDEQPLIESADGYAAESLGEGEPDRPGPSATSGSTVDTASVSRSLALPVPALEPEVITETPVALADSEAGANGAENRSIDQPAAATAVEGERIEVLLIFSQDSWVEAFDAQQRRLMFDMGTAGTQRTISGVAPLRIFLGYADGVSIKVDGETFPLQNARRRGNTAQLTIEGG